MGPSNPAASLIRRRARRATALIPELPFQFDDYYVDGVTAQVLRQMASAGRKERLAGAEMALLRFTIRER